MVHCKPVLICLTGFLLFSCRSHPLDSGPSGTGSDSTLVELRVDLDTEYQTIEGFGGFNSIHLAGDTWTVPLSEKYDVLAYDLGISMLRHEIDPRFWEAEDKPFNVQAPVFGGPSIADNFKDAEELRRRGVDRFIASVWSPPAWMKTNGQTSYGGRLKGESVGRFAEFMVGYIEAFKIATGLDLYAVSIQNEPDLSLPWNSCLYSPGEYASVLRVVRSAFRSRGIRTRLFGPEVFGPPAGCSGWIEAIASADSSSISGLDGFGLHIYNSGILIPYLNAQGWLPLQETCRKHGLSLWQTETSMVYGRDWNGAMDLASVICCGLKYGKLSAWCWWALADGEESAQYALIVDGKKENRYYASKHFYRYLRPGAVQVETVLAAGTPAAFVEDDVMAVAFRHKILKTVTIVVLNKSRNRKTIRIKMPGPADVWSSVTST